MDTGIRGAHVPYRGAAPAMQDIVSGAVEAGFVTAGASLPHIKTGVLRALAVSSLQRAPQLPDVPTAEEAGVKGFEAQFGNYILAPSRVDPRLRAAMGVHVAEVMKNKEVQDRLVSLATDPVFADEAASIARIAADREKWGKVVKASGMKASP
jgi:tripartite-type tricarboxylate transporter receptor subunit TctC